MYKNADSSCIFCQCHKNAKKTKRKVERESGPLKNWEKWLGERKIIQDKLTRSLEKPAGELLMNINEEIRKVREEKLIFAYSKITTEFDKLRGNPEFWQLPPGLKNNDCGARDPIHFIVKTKEDKNEIPTIEYVGTPQFVFDEKNVLPRTRSLFERWKRSSYRKIYLENMFLKLQFIEPHRPDQAELIVLGKGFKYNNYPFPTGKTPSLAKPQNIQEVSPISFEVNSIPKLLFFINGTSLSSEERLCNGGTKIRIFFNLNDIPTSPTVKILKFENRGLKTVRFYCKEFEKFRTFRDIAPNRKLTSPFYFQNTEIILVPGREFCLPILFKPNSSGHFKESWEITTLPKIWDANNYKVILFLQGIVYKGNLDEESNSIKKMLETNTRNTLIKEILNDTLKSLKCEETSKVTYTFSERVLFECANRETYGAEKRTRYLYNEVSVGKLRSFYKLMKDTTDNSEWNYSIDFLKAITRKRDVLDYLQNLTKKCLKAKQRLLQLNSPELSTPETDIDEIILDDKPLGTNYKNLEKLLFELERPCMIENKDREKHVSVYFILCSYISRMSVALEKVDRISSESVTSSYPSYDFEKATEVNDLPERLIFERFDDIWIERTKRLPSEVKTGFPMTPKPKNLENISPENTELIHDTYFKVSPKKENPKKNKVSEKKTPKVKKSKLKADLTVKQNLPEHRVKESFDPFADIELPLIPRELSISIPEKMFVTDEKSTEPSIDATKYEKYLIVYTHLCAAVEAVVDTLETFKEKEISSELLSELIPERPKYEKYEEIDEVSLMEEQYRSEKDSYFHCLVESHLNNNDAANKYFIGGETLSSVEEFPVQPIAVEPEPIPFLFKSHESLAIKSIESGTTPKSAGVQTSLEDNETEVSSENDSFEESEGSSGKKSSTISSDMYEGFI